MSEARELTVLFADVSGSTLLYERLDDASALQATERCMKRMERAVSTHAGRVLKAVGDELMAVFGPADDAFQAACEMQRTIHSLPLLSNINLALRVGFQRGPLIEEIDVFIGACVDGAAHLTGLAKPGQILTDLTTRQSLPGPLQAMTLSLGKILGRDDAGDPEAFEVRWQEPCDIAVTSQPLPNGQDDAAVRPSQLAVSYAGQLLTLDETNPKLRLGRDAGCDIEIRAPHASRRHARIELREGHFVLTDESSNGTYVTFIGETEVLLRHSEMVLRGSGTLSFATPATTANADCARFEHC